MSSRRTGLNWVVVAVFSGLLLLASLVPKENLGKELRRFVGENDKILHGVAYGVLAVLSCRALAGRRKVGWGHVLGGVLVAASYGAVLEVLQGALGHRKSSVLDAGANALGAASGGLLWLVAAVRSNGSRVKTRECKS